MGKDHIHQRNHPDRIHGTKVSAPHVRKEDRLDIVHNQRRKIRWKNNSSVLGVRALTVVTNQNLRKVELSSKRDDIIMLKEPHLIRKVAY